MRRIALVVGLCLSTGLAHAQEAAPVPVEGPPIVDVEAVLVTGVQPGPGLWRVYNGENTLYILGTQSPLPRDMTWDSREVRQVLAEAGVVLYAPGVTIDADVGFFRGMTMLPSALKAARNPDGRTLDEVLPADLYQHWSRLKQRYAPRDRGMEKKRPLIAVYELYKEALERNGPRQGGVVGPVIEAALKQRDMKSTPTTFKIRIDDPRAALAEFRQETLKPEDLACFRDTLDIIEQQLPAIAARANAWATGDIEALRAMPDARSQTMACLSAWTETEVARRRGLIDVDTKVRAAWLQAADAALKEHRVGFALLPISDLLGGGGYLAQLQAKGYEVESP